MTDLSTRFREAYDREAEIYDETRYGIPGGREYLELSNEVAVKMISELARQAGRPMWVLDFATGTGRVARAISQIPGVTVVGLDISRGMLSKAATWSSGEERDNVMWLVGDGLQLPFRDASFDHVISFKFLHIMENIHHSGFIRELLRVLKPGGRLIMEANNGIFGTLIPLKNRRYRRKHTRFYWPHHRYTLYREFPIVEVVGLWFPFTAVLRRLSPRLANFLNRISAKSPLKVLCGKSIIVLEKPRV